MHSWTCRLVIQVTEWWEWGGLYNIQPYIASGKIFRALHVYDVFVYYGDNEWSRLTVSLLYRYDKPDGVSNHQPYECLLNRSSRRRSKKTPKPRVIGLCEGNSLVTSEFPAQRASNAENYSIWWRHLVMGVFLRYHRSNLFQVDAFCAIVITKDSILC